ncbi:FecCD family ABC transporter permease [Hahella ganghwensis]|uniref:FecCD family ABC transporter permease n=1 Tax=Hahella ganghwensis TaxID=286420 RepID=UPI00036E5999|nr:iron ABC transporter permease [Hahella ganghwensis]
MASTTLSRFSAPQVWFILLLLLLVTVVVAVGQGAYSISWQQLLPWNLQNHWEAVVQDGIIVWHIRLPRILLSALVGAALAMAGSALQGLFRNPLADPGLIGISGGAALAVSMTIVLLPWSMGYMGLYALSISAFIGGLMTCMVIFKIGKIGSMTSVGHLILAGVAINALAMAGVGLMTFLSDDQQMRTLNFWMLGSFGGALWPAVLMQLTITLPAGWLLWRQSKALNRLLLGEEEARFLGTDTETLKNRVVTLSALLVGASVAVSGIIGFVGLVVPHLIRLLWRADHHILIPASALLGASLMVLADTLARTLVIPAEIPVGIVTSLVGGPFFLWLLMKPHTGMRHD